MPWERDSAKILLIEDNPDIVQVVQYELQQADHQVMVALDGLSGLRRVRETNPDLVILELELPDMDGSDVVHQIRTTSNVPILVLTAVDAVNRKVALLEAGANDYVTKPFHPQELLARVRVQLRQPQEQEVTSLGALQIFPHRRQVQYNAKEVPLSSKEFDLLSLLAQRPGRIYSREELERELWSRELTSTSNLVDVHIANLRAKLRKQDGYGLVRTVRGRGYALKSQK